MGTVSVKEGGKFRRWMMVRVAQEWNVLSATELCSYIWLK